MRSRLLVAAAAVLLILLVGVSFDAVHRSGVGGEPSELESAILPPKAFRDWFEGERQGLIDGPKDVDPPMDRFAARGDHHTPTVMPQTDAQKELQEARKNMEETKKAVGIMLEEAEAKLKESPEDQGAVSEVAKAHELLDAAVKMLAAAQRKVNAMNKDLVLGQARGWNKDNGLGGSDKFVPIGQAQAQLDGAGYGHRYSVTDWLAGN